MIRHEKKYKLFLQPSEMCHKMKRKSKKKIYKLLFKEKKKLSVFILFSSSQTKFIFRLKFIYGFKIAIGDQVKIEITHRQREEDNVN